jgi:hypothetical protein
MKVKSVIIAVLLTAVIFSFAGEKQSPLLGTWKPVSRIIILADTTYTLTEDQLSGMVKIINKTHFATIFQGATLDSSMFNGGNYELTEDTYTENLEYNSNPSLIGRSLTYDSKIEGDQWTISGPVYKKGEEELSWKIKEVYKKVD